jgi:hypothetical protein
VDGVDETTHPTRMSQSLIPIRAIRTSSGSGPRTTRNTFRLNPSIPTRAFRTTDHEFESEGMGNTSQFLNTDQSNSDHGDPISFEIWNSQSQSLNTDRGNSDHLRSDIIRMYGVESQSLDTDQGNSNLGHPERPLPGDGPVSIPQYQSGQFGRLSCTTTSVITAPCLNPSIPIRAIRTATFPSPAIPRVYETVRVTSQNALRKPGSSSPENSDIVLKSLHPFRLPNPFYLAAKKGFRRWHASCQARRLPRFTVFSFQRKLGYPILPATRHPHQSRPSTAIRPNPNVAPLPTCRISAARRSGTNGVKSPSRSKRPSKPPKSILVCWRLL